MALEEYKDKNGKGTEKFVCKVLKKYGYWAYNIPMKTNGQPFDIVSAKGLGEGKMMCWFADAKHVEENKVSFTFDRIEPNQITSMSYITQFAKVDANYVGFAIFFERTKSLYWFPYALFLKLTQLDCKSVNLSDLEDFEEVLKNADRN